MNEVTKSSKKKSSYTIPQISSSQDNDNNQHYPKVISSVRRPRRKSALSSGDDTENYTDSNTNIQLSNSYKSLNTRNTRSRRNHATKFTSKFNLKHKSIFILYIYLKVPYYKTKFIYIELNQSFYDEQSSSNQHADDDNSESPSPPPLPPSPPPLPPSPPSLTSNNDENTAVIQRIASS